MKRVPLPALIAVLVPALVLFSNPKDPDKKSSPAVVSYSAYVFLAQSNGEEISYPLLPGEIAVTTVETVIGTTQEYIDKLRSLYSYPRYSLLTTTGGIFSIGLSEREGGFISYTNYGEKRLVFSLGASALEVPRDGFLSLRIEAGLDTLSSGESKILPKPSLLRVLSSVKSGHPMVIGREIPRAEGHRRAIFVVFTPFFSVLESQEQYWKALADYQRILKLIPAERNLADAKLLGEINEYAKVTLKVQKIRPAEEILAGVPPPPPPPPGLKDDSIVFVPYDQPPEPVGGFTAIQRRLVYPEPARKAGLEGKVLVYAQIDEEGVVSNTRVAQSLPGCDEAAVAAIMGVRWKPALQKDKPVKVWVMVPVDFRLK